MAGKEVRIGGAKIDYTAKDAGFTRATKKVNNQLTGFEKRAGKAKAASRKLSVALAGIAVGPLKALAVGLGSALSGKAMGDFIKAQGEVATKMEQFSTITGLTITQLQIFQKGMGEFAIASNTSNKALQTLTKATGEAKRGLKSYQDAFESLGISMESLEGKSMQEVLNAVARGLKETEDPAKRTAAAMLLFGGRGVEVAAALRQVSFENAAYVQSIVDTGILTQQEADKLKKVTTAYDTLGDTMETIKLKAAAGVSDEWVDFVNTITENAPKLERALGAVLSTGIFLVEQLTNAINLFQKTYDKVKDLAGYLPGIDIKGHDAAVKMADENENISYAKARRYIDAMRALMDEEAKWLQTDMANTPVAELHLKPLREEYKAAADAIAAAIKAPTESVETAVDENAKKLEDAILRTEELNRKAALKAAAIRKADADADAASEKARARMRLYGVGYDISPEVDIRAKSESDAVAMMREREDRLRLESAMKDPLNAFGGAGPNVITDAQLEKIRMYKAEVKLIDNAWIKLSDTTRDRLAPVFDGLDNQLDNFFTSIIDGTASASDAFKNLASQIAQAVLQALVLQPLVNSITGGVGNFFGIPTEARASGGPVAARSPYIVGERGPELFVPDVAGNIVPNHRMGRGDVTITQSFNINSTDGPGVQKALAEAAPIFRRDALAAVREADDRPGGLST